MISSATKLNLKECIEFITQETSSEYDAYLLKTIKDRIRWDVRVTNYDIHMKVKDGIVSLYGYFDKSYRKLAALKIIGTTEGVIEVQDHSQILDDYYRTDSDIEKLILKHIMRESLLEGEWINVNSKDGVVTLEGSVYRPQVKAMASRITWALSGVRDCHNVIKLLEQTELPQEVSESAAAEKAWNETAIQDVLI